MDNFELHELAQELSDTHSPYKLAKALIEACDELSDFLNSEPLREEDVDLESMLKDLLQ